MLLFPPLTEREVRILIAPFPEKKALDDHGRDNPVRESWGI